MFSHRGQVLPSPPIALQEAPNTESPKRQKSLSLLHCFDAPQANVPVVQWHLEAVPESDASLGFELPEST